MKRRLSAAPGRSQSGYALLTVSVMAVMIAIGFYLALPRMLFEAQREKEQLLIDRGEQYTLAIRRFYVKAGRYPTSMDELESFQGMRFLRRRYKDPMTKSGEWRIIHVNPAGIMTDSLTQPAGQAGQLTAAQTSSFGTLQGSTLGNTLQGTMPGANNPSSGSSADNGATPSAAYLGQRASDREAGQAGGPGNTGLGANNPENADLQQPQYPPDSNLGSGQQQQPGQPGQTPQEPGAPGLPYGTGQQPGANPQQQPGLASGQPGGVGNAAQLIMSQLTHPPQNAGATAAGGMVSGPQGTASNSPFSTGPGGTASNSPFSGASGPMIAGVASKDEQQGIKVYNDKTKYNLWEFLFDYRKALQQPSGTGTATPGTNAPGSPAQNNSPFSTNPIGGNAPGAGGAGITGPQSQPPQPQPQPLAPSTSP